jgi:SAM-dependent methyltransferase
VIKERLVGQFRNPHGPLGWVAGRIMSKRESNVLRTLATVDLLELSATDRVLEIGHGPGIGLEAALAVAGEVVGLERSTAMRSMAARRNRSAVENGRLALVVADARHPPPEVAGFDAIFSSNVWQFWVDPVATLTAWRDRLVPHGTMAVTFRPPLTGATEDEALAAGERIVAQLEEAGYVDVRLESIPIGDVPAVCGLGRRSAE